MRVACFVGKYRPTVAAQSAQCWALPTDAQLPPCALAARTPPAPAGPWSGLVHLQRLRTCRRRRLRQRRHRILGRRQSGPWHFTNRWRRWQQCLVVFMQPPPLEASPGLVDVASCPSASPHGSSPPPWTPPRRVAPHPWHGRMDSPLLAPRPPAARLPAPDRRRPAPGSNGSGRPRNRTLSGHFGLPRAYDVAELPLPGGDGRAGPAFVRLPQASWACCHAVGLCL